MDTLGLWMAKARMEAEAGRPGLVVALVPALTDSNPTVRTAYPGL
jgi:hypothetical protein